MKDYVQIPKKFIDKTKNYFEKMRDFVLDKDDAERLAYWITKIFKGSMGGRDKNKTAERSKKAFSLPLAGRL